LVDLSKFSTANVQGGGAAPTSNSNAVATSQPAAVATSEAVAEATPTEAAQASKATTATSQPTAASGSGASTTSGNNIQTFTGTLGGPPPPVISGTGNRPFTVKGNTFVNAAAALQRSCDTQHNACADAANSGQLSGGVGQCDEQNNQCSAAATSSASNASAVNNNSSSNNGNNGGSNSAASNNTTAADSGNGATASFGSCSNPAIKFANNLDGRTEPAFAPVDETDFNHGSALNIKVIADFICDRLNSSCKAGAAVVAKCQSAATAASQQTGQAAADAFNAALGVSAN
jgi:hypothetical protein